jgi:hypothetical protein
MDGEIIGTVGHGSTLPKAASDWPSQNTLRGRIGTPAASMSKRHSSATANSSGYASARCGGYNHNAAALIRSARRRDMMAAIEEWRRASGTDRDWWRSQAGHLIREWRRLHVQPERAAFQAAVAASQLRRAAA